jgi:hypothetical protein
MILSPQTSVEEFVIETLALKNLTAEQLLLLHNKNHKKVTLQAVYKVLHKLVIEEILLKHKNEYALSNIWRQRVVSLLDKKQTVPVGGVIR